MRKSESMLDTVFLCTTRDTTHVDQSPMMADRYKFVCGKCGYTWYSSSPGDSKCSKCGNTVHPIKQ